LKKVLIITYYWPPAGGSGVQRWLKFVKYLPEFGVEPYILTVKPEKASYPVLDESLLQDVPEDLNIFYSNIIDANNIYAAIFGKKVPYGSISKNEKKSFVGKLSSFIRANVFVPDSRMLWHLHAKPKALEIINQFDIDTVVTTGPPQSTHFVGLKLKKALPDLKWVVDFRDPWTKSFINDFLDRTKRTIKKDQQNEQKVLQLADEIILVSKGMKDDFSIPLKNFHTIYNGYDENDFINVHQNKNNAKFSINYVGTFKDNQYFDSVWDALEELMKEIPEIADDLEINFAGIVNPLFKEKITKYSFKNKINYIGYVSHRQAIEYMVSASLLFFPIPQTEYNHNIITGKIFEYLASASPILAIGPPNGIAAEILAECERKSMIEYQNKEAIKKQILEEYQYWKANGNRKVKNNLHQKYSRKNQTKALTEILKKK
tara:strand:+ start:38853 stop:40145 length:1293 start_codon:yes stop_codon:yes gene_type:complete